MVITNVRVVIKINPEIRKGLSLTQKLRLIGAGLKEIIWGPDLEFKDSQSDDKKLSM